MVLFTKHTNIFAAIRIITDLNDHIDPISRQGYLLLKTDGRNFAIYFMDVCIWDSDNFTQFNEDGDLVPLEKILKGGIIETIEDIKNIQFKEVIK